MHPLGKEKLFIFSLTSSHQVLFHRPPSSYNTIQSSSCPNYLSLPFPITKLTGSNPYISLDSAFSSFQYPSDHIHFSSISCSTFIIQDLMTYIRQLLTQLVHILPFSFNENHFPVNISVSTWNNFFHTCWHCRSTPSVYI